MVFHICKIGVREAALNDGCSKELPTARSECSSGEYEICDLTSRLMSASEEKNALASNDGIEEDNDGRCEIAVCVKLRMQRPNCTGIV